MTNIIPIPAFNDNYIWAIVHPETHFAAIVDPGDARPVINFLTQQDLQLAAILITHHHYDHTGGIDGLLAYQHVPVYGPHNRTIAQIDYPLNAGDQIHLSKLDIDFRILEIPGHTLDHIAYIGLNSVFCGDTLFAGGCGRLFEGSAEQMLDSLDQLAALPQETQVYCAHEYTEANLQFAKQVEPNRSALIKRIADTEIIRQKTQPSLPSTIQLERDTNPFLRVRTETVKKSVEAYAKKALDNPVDVFTELRKWKDHY